MMMKCYVAFGLFLSITVTVQSQLTVTWQGETVTGPLLIFHSEIQQTVNSNSLTCSHPTGPVAWYLAVRNIELSIQSYATFINVMTDGGRQAQIRRGTNDRDERSLDGLWTCRLNGTAGAGAFHVGIYDDTPNTTNGAITNVQGRSSQFTTNPISFQLFGDSTGGPPTTSYWSRNGVNITNNSTFSISISFTGPFNDAGYRAANYRSTLTVTTDQPQPGTYLYHVSNRRTTGPRTAQVLVDGDPPTGLTLSRVGLDRVRVTWTEPDIRPRGGYRIEVVSGNINMTSDMSPQEITLTPRSTPYEVALVSLSRHYPINNIMRSIILNDLLAPTSPSISTLTATSVTISWTQPLGGLTVNIYRVTLTTTSTGMCPGFNHTREKNTTSTSIMIDGLEENSIYIVTISAMNNEFNAINTTSGLTITTLATAPTGQPRNVMSSTVTSSNITVIWEDINCIDRNGRITSYDVMYGVLGEAMTVRSGISGRSFTADELKPFTNYTVQVRGVNSVDSGPYSDLIIITTSEAAPGPVSNLMGIATLTTVVLNWSPPQQPNGIITSYTVTYRVNGNTRNIDDPGTTFTIPSLFPQTTISNISVRASTSRGHGPEVTLVEDVLTLARPPEVMGVDVEILTDTSVRVSWERILNIPEITHYTVFYSRVGNRTAGEQSRNVPSSNNSVDLEGLSGNARSHLFVVLAVATVNNVEISGERPAIPFTLPSSSSSSDEDVCSGDVSIAVVVTFLLTIILHTIVMLLTCYIYSVCYANRTKSTIKQTEKGNTEDTYEVITTKVDSHDFAMRECAAYGPVPSTQAQYEVKSSPQTEGTYESV